MADLPIMPIKTDALLADTGHMSAEEFGSYCRLLFTMWRHEGRLPDDAAHLARIAGVSLRRWKTISNTVLRPMTAAGGQLSQKRLTSTWLDVQELRKKRAFAAEKRWTSKRNASASTGAQAEQYQKDKLGNANQNQIRRKITSSEQEAARPSSVETSQEQTNPAGLLATALPTGALARQPETEQAASGANETPSPVEPPQAFDKEARAKLDALLLARRKPKEEIDLSIPGFLKRKLA